MEFPTWLDQVYTKADYDLTIVNHVEPRDIANYAQPAVLLALRHAGGAAGVAAPTTAATQEEATAFLKNAARRISEDSAADWLLPGRGHHGVDEVGDGLPDDASTDAGSPSTGIAVP